MRTRVVLSLLLLAAFSPLVVAPAAEPWVGGGDLLGSLARLDAAAGSGGELNPPAALPQIDNLATGGMTVAPDPTMAIPPPSYGLAGQDGVFAHTVGVQLPPERIEEMADRVLDLEPNGQNRRLIERVRAATLETEVGVDTTDQPWVHVKDHSYITWGGRINADWVNWANDSQFIGQNNYVEFRRLRLFAAGEGYGVYDYKLELEFAPEVELQADVVDNHVDLGGFGVELKDAYIGILDLPRLGYVRLGHFKTPIGLEELTSSKYITFLERSLAHRLVPGRELGIAAMNHSADENITWVYGAFFDTMSESSHVIDDNNQGVRLATRATWTPFYDSLSQGRNLIHTGLGYCYTRPRRRDDPLAPGSVFRPVEFDARPEIHRGDHMIDTGDVNCQQYQLLDAEFAWVRGPLSVQSEVVWAHLDVLGDADKELRGAYAFVSYFLTGEHRVYDRQRARFTRVKPFENFWMVRTPCGTRAGWGAWEVAARWSYLDFCDVEGQRLHDLTLGCNWYWNPHARMMFNWIHPFAHHSPVSAAADAEGDIIAMRFQVDF